MKPQSAAIPFRIDPTRGLEVLLVTSRGTRRWILPKGKVKSRTLPSRSAEREAFEEAGVLGRIDPRAVGTYWQGDALPGDPGGSVPVLAFALEVTDVLDSWDEMHLRRRRWFRIGRARIAVRDPQLRAILKAFQRQFRPGSPPARA